MRDRRCDEGSGKTVVPLRRASLAEGSGGRNPPFGGHFLIWRRARSEEHTSELQSPCNLVCRLLLEKKKTHTSPQELTCPHPPTPRPPCHRDPPCSRPSALRIVPAGVPATLSPAIRRKSLSAAAPLY